MAKGAVSRFVALLAGDLQAQAQGEQGVGLPDLRVAPSAKLDQARRAQLLLHQVAHVVGAHRPVEALAEGGRDLGRVALAVDLLEGGVEQGGQLDRLAVGPADEARGLLVARCLVLPDELDPGGQAGGCRAPGCRRRHPALRRSPRPGRPALPATRGMRRVSSSCCAMLRSGSEGSRGVSQPAAALAPPWSMPASWVAVAIAVAVEVLGDDRVLVGQGGRLGVDGQDVGADGGVDRCGHVGVGRDGGVDGRGHVGVEVEVDVDVEQRRPEQRRRVEAVRAPTSPPGRARR